jgi:7,8-dihydro-6-hydroxymethylpterin dimethyltransferase
VQAATATSSITVLSTTESVCPVCLRRINAERTAEGDDVYLRKTCPDHGSFRTILWRGLASWHAWGRFIRRAARPPQCTSPISHGCPFDCGLCPDHRQHTCCVVVEVTARCNLTCPICFADAAPVRAQDPTLDEIIARCRALLASGGPFNVQLSGGEPTIRNDLPQMVERIRSMGFPFVQLNTNGIRLAKDHRYACSLREAGLDCVFLQFDGTTAGTYSAIRGRDLLDIKLAALRHCGEAHLGVVLVPTLVPGVNTNQIGDILRLAISSTPAVRAVHFQPVSYFGRYPRPPRDSDRITIPEVLRGIEEQTSGLFRASDFHPPSAENAYCSFQGQFRIGASGSVEPASSPPQTSCCGSKTAPPLVQPGDGARRARQYVARQWAYPPVRESTSCCSSEPELASFDRFLAASARTLSVSGMAFQDAWNLDLERLRECFLHSVDVHQRLIPLCAWNLTASNGRALYRGGTAEAGAQ